jgi:hypothetical protein
MSDVVDKIIAFESGEMTPPEMVYFFSELIKSGMAYTLQGSYGRTANRLIEVGILFKDGDIDEMKAIEMGIDM